MFYQFVLLAQAQQPQRFPWGFLLFGLLAVAAVVLLVYFMTRVRKSEKEAEEDWGFSNRGFLLTPSTARAPEVKKESPPAPKAVPIPREPEPLPIAAAPKAAEPESVPAAPKAAEPESVTESPGMPDTHVVATAHPEPLSIEPDEIIPVPADQDTLFEPQHQEPVAAAQTKLAHADQGSPFDEEIWTQLESPEPPAIAPQPEIKPPASSPTRIDPTALRVSEHRKRYEPPRIDPIVPRTE